ncbi:unnamed protein product [Adineta ricciae]|uniref:Uncharacterized protein n=1 Tax=Adineta ricciae TaxID=249248 RepID=A0A813VJD6_ADIRI|nr:unnamed protein product [Adineta ricciae]CAF0849366.1 unnamed protein product [Adineta ricciae]
MASILNLSDLRKGALGSEVVIVVAVPGVTGLAVIFVVNEVHAVDYMRECIWKDHSSRQSHVVAVLILKGGKGLLAGGLGIGDELNTA